jgi:hypothetical protein
MSQSKTHSLVPCSLFSLRVLFALKKIVRFTLSLAFQAEIGKQPRFTRFLGIGGFPQSL